MKLKVRSSQAKRQTTAWSQALSQEIPSTNVGSFLLVRRSLLETMRRTPGWTSFVLKQQCLYQSERIIQRHAYMCFHIAGTSRDNFLKIRKVEETDVSFWNQSNKMQPPTNIFTRLGVSKNVDWFTAQHLFRLETQTSRSLEDLDLRSTTSSHQHEPSLRLLYLYTLFVPQDWALAAEQRLELA